MNFDDLLEEFKTDARPKSPIRSNWGDDKPTDIKKDQKPATIFKSHPVAKQSAFEDEWGVVGSSKTNTKKAADSDEDEY
jgi:hypothetical protein